jgi:hypothetical protein
VIGIQNIVALEPSGHSCFAGEGKPSPDGRGLFVNGIERRTSVSNHAGIGTRGCAALFSLAGHLAGGVRSTELGGLSREAHLDAVGKLLRCITIPAGPGGRDVLFPDNLDADASQRWRRPSR